MSTRPGDDAKGPGRIEFANQLRGLAAACVALSHLLGVYWILPGVVSAVTFSPPQGGAPPAALAVVAWPWFNFGPFGVALFFLISGLVIPFSFATHGRTAFLFARLLRIYPTYMVAFLLQVGVIYAASRYWGLPFTVSARAIVTNLLLVYDLLGEPSLDLVNWTLSVELKFYLLALVLRPALVQGRIVPVLVAASMLLAVNVLFRTALPGLPSAVPSTPVHTASSHAVCLGYMLVGIAFNFHHRGLLSTAGLLVAAPVLLAAFALSWRLSVWEAQMPLVSNNYLFALVLFAGCYVLRRHVPKTRVLTMLAAISFPFYLVHSLLGYSGLRFLMVGEGWAYGPALVFTLMALLLVATILHVGIERPSVLAGRWLGSRRNGPLVVVNENVTCR